MRVVVTGATSMIGVALIKECISNNCEVLAVVRSETKRLKRLPNSKLIRIEYANMDKILSVQGDGRPYDIFYHLAWSNTGKEERDMPLIQEKNIRTTLEAVELAHKLGCQKFIGAGSQAEYGPQTQKIFYNTPPSPITAYGMAKYAANILSSRMCEQLDILHIWGRIFSVYGCHDNEGTMINYAIDCFQSGVLAHFSAGTQMWDYLYEDDAGKMFYLLGSKCVEGGIYCIASGKAFCLKDYIIQLKELVDPGALIEFSDANNPKEIFGLQVDIRHTVEAISYMPETTFEQGIQTILEARKIKNPAQNIN